MKKTTSLFVGLSFIYACDSHHLVEKKTITIIDSTVEEANLEEPPPPKSFNFDSMSKVNALVIQKAGTNITKASISNRDSAFSITTNKYRDHRIFGFEKPTVNSKKLILFSIFATDVNGNPYHFPLGSYYNTNDTHGLSFKYLQLVDNFIKVSVTGPTNRPIMVYFEKKWVEFDNP